MFEYCNEAISAGQNNSSVVHIKIRKQGLTRVSCITTAGAREKKGCAYQDSHEFWSMAGLR